MSEFRLSNLGKYKIDRTEDYGWAKSTGEDLAYYEMIRVKGSKLSRYFTVPSHLYKYGEHTLALYLKDHKNYWRQLSVLSGQEIDISDEEALFKFPVDKFGDVSKIVKFVRKKSRNTPLSVNERKRSSADLTKYHKKDIDIIEESKEKSTESMQLGTIMPIEEFYHENVDYNQGKQKKQRMPKIIKKWNEKIGTDSELRWEDRVKELMKQTSYKIDDDYTLRLHVNDYDNDFCINVFDGDEEHYGTVIMMVDETSDDVAMMRYENIKFIQRFVREKLPYLRYYKTVDNHRYIEENGFQIYYSLKDDSEDNGEVLENE